MKFKKSKEMFILPIIFIFLFVLAVISIAIYARNSKSYVILSFISVPGSMLIGTMIYLIYLITRENILINIEDGNLYTKGLKIPLSDIDYTAVRKGILSMYHPALLIVLKDKNIIPIKYLSDPYNVSKEINKNYLKIKGNWQK